MVKKTMRQSVADVLEYYATPGEVTDAREHVGQFERLPREVPALCSVVHGLLIHILEAERYGVRLTRKRREEVRIGHVAGMLSRILELDPHPLSVARPPERRLVVTCHDFSVLLCAILRYQDQPARPRPGFAAYLVPGKYIDHWVCECWEPSGQRWVPVDAQLDEVQCRAYHITFDPCDVPSDQFLAAGEAWRLCRTGQAKPDCFGFSRWWGWGYLRHNLLRDLLALNKVELLPWNSAGLPERDEEQVSDQERATLDRIASLTLDSKRSGAAVHAAYSNVVRLGSPPDWRPWRLEEV